MFGQLYAIDEDAFELLNRYLDSMKRYFSDKEGGEEIADDIEHRVAELLWQQKEEGTMAISIEVIKEIIGKIGNLKSQQASAILRKVFVKLSHGCRKF